MERGVKEIRARGGRKSVARRRDSGREHEECIRREEGKTEPPTGKHCLVSHPQAAGSRPV